MKTMRMRRGIGLAAAALLLSGGIGVTTTGSAPSAQAAAAPAKIRVIQHNTDQKKWRWMKVVRQLEQGGWNAASLQEVCQSWVKDLRVKHPGWTIAYHEQTSNDRCPAGKGNVAIRPGAGDVFAEAYDVAGEGKNFGIACAAFGFSGRRVHMCSTHFTTYDPNEAEVRRLQAERVKTITDRWIGQGHTVILGGDLNAEPTATELDPIYQYPEARSHGSFVEAAQLQAGRKRRVGAPTHDDRKIDYVFFSSNTTPIGSGGTLRLEKTGGHRILYATTTLR